MQGFLKLRNRVRYLPFLNESIAEIIMGESQVGIDGQGLLNFIHGVADLSLL